MSKKRYKPVNKNAIEHPNLKLNIDKINPIIAIYLIASLKILFFIYSPSSTNYLDIIIYGKDKISKLRIFGSDNMDYVN